MGASLGGLWLLAVPLTRPQRSGRRCIDISTMDVTHIHHIHPCDKYPSVHYIWIFTTKRYSVSSHYGPNSLYYYYIQNVITIHGNTHYTSCCYCNLCQTELNHTVSVSALCICHLCKIEKHKHYTLQSNVCRPCRARCKMGVEYDGGIMTHNYCS